MTDKDKENNKGTEETVMTVTGYDSRKTAEKYNLFKKLKAKIRMPYYYVPPCPYCGSVRTGRFVEYRRDTQDQYTEKMSLKNGELIQFVAKIDPEASFFCADCGTTWSEYAPMKWFTMEEIEEEKKKRGTAAYYTETIEEEKDERKHRKGGPILRLFAKFIGKI